MHVLDDRLESAQAVCAAPFTQLLLDDEPEARQAVTMVFVVSFVVGMALVFAVRWFMRRRQSEAAATGARVSSRAAWHAAGVARGFTVTDEGWLGKDVGAVHVAVEWDLVLGPGVEGIRRVEVRTPGGSLTSLTVDIVPTPELAPLGLAGGERFAVMTGDVGFDAKAFADRPWTQASPLSDASVRELLAALTMVTVHFDRGSVTVVDHGATGPDELLGFADDLAAWLGRAVVLTRS